MASSFEQLGPCLDAYDAYISILQDQAIEPIHDDPVIAAYSEAMTDYCSAPNVRKYFVEHLFPHLLVQGPIDPWVVHNTGFRSVHGTLLHMPFGESVTYPDESFDDPDTFRALLPIVADVSGNPATSRFIGDITFRKVQSNKPLRYASVKLLGMPIPEIGPGTEILDVGASQNQGLKQIELDLPFDPIAVDSGLHIIASDRNTAAAEAVNNRLAEHMPLGDSYGLDYFRITDVECRDWVKTCSILPSELRNPKLVAEYDHIQNSNPTNIRFAQADFGLRTINPFPENPNKTFDLVTFFTMLYQIPPHERRIMFEHALRYSRRYIFIQDAAKKITNKALDSPIDELHFDTAYFNEDYGYRAFIYDKLNPALGFQELWRWKSGRCGELQLISTGPMAVKALETILKTRQSNA